ncbi:MAG: methylglyoxal synthase [Bacilli bacterium]
MRIALIAHDKKKDEMIQFAIENEAYLVAHDLCATGTTGKLINISTNLNVYCYKSGPLGGDQEIGAQVANGYIDLVIFFRDPLTSQPHEPDISALLRLCDVYEIPLATNISTAKMIIRKGDYSC